MERHSFERTVMALAIGFGLSAGALAQSTSPGQSPLLAPSPANPTATTQAPGATALKGPVVAVDATSIGGKVKAIMPASRQVIIEGERGRMAKIFVGPNVRNFENLKLGDPVTMRYTEALSLAIAKGGIGTESQIGEIRTKVEADAARQAAPGGKPGISAVERATLVANVFQIEPGACR